MLLRDLGIGVDVPRPDGRVLRLCSAEGGATISSIGRELGITRQGAQQRWGNSPPQVTDTSSTPNWKSCP